MNILFPLENRKNGFSLALQGKSDNIAAIAWLLKNKVKSLATQTTCMIQNYMQVFSKVDFVSVIHLPGKEMKDIDIESRREEFLGASEYCVSLPPEKELDMDSYPIIRRFIQLSDPTSYANCLQDLHASFLAVASEFGDFVHRSDNLKVKFKDIPPSYKLITFDHNSKKRISSQLCNFV
jgi:hypothetical protein